MALPNRSQLNIEDYFQLDRESTEARYEYIDGQIRMLAGGTPDHAKIATYNVRGRIKRFSVLQHCVLPAGCNE